MRALRILVAILVLAGFVAGCGEERIKTPDNPTPPPKGEPISTSAPTAPADQ